MALALRTRLTLWYSGLLLLGILLFSATVLWLHWRMLLHQQDESLEALTTMAANVVADELSEHETLARAAAEVESLVRDPAFAVAVFDRSGVAVQGTPLARRIGGVVHATNAETTRAATFADDQGRPWRLSFRPVEHDDGPAFTVAIAAPMQDIVGQWNALLRACAIGVPFVLLIAAIGGWILGHRGLQPLASMAHQARGITAQEPTVRLDVPAAPELEAVAVSFNRVLDRLGDAIATQRRFMADASHELRTPVSIMRTAADVTLNQPSREEPEYREALTAVSQQSTRLARLVDDMLVLARSDAGGYPVVRAEVDLDSVVEDSIRELSPRAVARRIRVTSHLCPATVTADEALVRRMLGNLLNNALIYTGGGGSVHVAMLRNGSSVSVQVADSGPGIPFEERERVFERFVRLDPARGEGGTGLGLSIARWVAEIHGGRVEIVRSGPDGTVFSATLPADVLTA